MKFLNSIVLAATLATGVVSFLPPIEPLKENGWTPPLSNAVINSAAYASFLHSETVNPHYEKVQRRHDNVDPINQTYVTPDQLYTLMCTLPGFRGDCLVFGSSPGSCVSWWSYQPWNSTAVSDRFNDKVFSLASNTGGQCMFYKDLQCNQYGNDSGITKSYVYNFGLPIPEDETITDYEQAITSWRC
ncbi:hypothetical protein IAQ61_000676 [Plenodomus lingam]|uniref:Secreted protein n=1 Tax=Leptosphaeria maculans (strain JN3 / isolate v23.1.3 / race Av1-4-5-6-7-8) TaxID=985895 RepID=E5A6G4_LEPMJ|nr:predicted protein [Plenodomus lingam JN3]KAH9880385.1 hypothetical protein IAQ61_000676 [Plenodomus lingam]CBX99209.1 predicted protein [Plenodomus lingam JN3]